MAASETGRLGSHDQPFRREVRPHGGAQPSRGHGKERLRADVPTWTELRLRTGTHGGASAPTCGLGWNGASASGKPEKGLGPKEASASGKPETGLRSNGASASGETGFVPDRTELRLREGWNHRDEVGDCRDPDWSDIVTSEQTPRGQDFGRASSGFCASRGLSRAVAKTTDSSRKRTGTTACKATHRVASSLSTQKGNPMRAPKGNQRRAGVKASQDSETDSTDGTTARWAGVKAPPHQPRLTVRRKVVSFGS